MLLSGRDSEVLAMLHFVDPQQCGDEGALPIESANEKSSGLSLSVQSARFDSEISEAVEPILLEQQTLRRRGLGGFWSRQTVRWREDKK